MGNLLWSGLNAVVILGLLYVFFRATILVKQYLGASAALIFMAGLLLVGCRPTGVPAADTINLLAKTGKTPSVGSAQHSIPLGVGIRLRILVEYQQRAIIEPRGLYAFVTGLLLGHTWRPLVGQVEPTGQQLRYFVVMQHDWKLLDWTVFSETTEYKGAMLL